MNGSEEEGSEYSIAESSFLHRILSPGIIAAFGGTLVLAVGVGVGLCICCVKMRMKKKERERGNKETELTVALTSDSTLSSSEESSEEENTQAPSRSDSMNRYLNTEEQDANRYTKYDSQKPYLE